MHEQIFYCTVKVQSGDVAKSWTSCYKTRYKTSIFIDMQGSAFGVHWRERCLGDAHQVSPGSPGNDFSFRIAQEFCETNAIERYRQAAAQVKSRINSSHPLKGARPSPTCQDDRPAPIVDKWYLDNPDCWSKGAGVAPLFFWKSSSALDRVLFYICLKGHGCERGNQGNIWKVKIFYLWCC